MFLKLRTYWREDLKESKLQVMMGLHLPLIPKAEDIQKKGGYSSRIGGEFSTFIGGEMEFGLTHTTGTELHENMIRQYQRRTGDYDVVQIGKLFMVTAGGVSTAVMLLRPKDAHEAPYGLVHETMTKVDERYSRGLSNTQGRSGRTHFFALFYQSMDDILNQLYEGRTFKMEADEMFCLELFPVLKDTYTDFLINTEVKQEPDMPHAFQIIEESDRFNVHQDARFNLVRGDPGRGSHQRFQSPVYGEKGDAAAGHVQMVYCTNHYGGVYHGLISDPWPLDTQYEYPGFIRETMRERGHDKESQRARYEMPEIDRYGGTDEEPEKGKKGAGKGKSKGKDKDQEDWKGKGKGEPEVSKGEPTMPSAGPAGADGVLPARDAVRRHAAQQYAAHISRHPRWPIVHGLRGKGRRL